MNPENKNLDELITDAISRETPEFDFNKWKQNHKKEIDIFESQVKPNSVPFERNIRSITLWRKVGYIAASILIISSLVTNFVLSNKVTGLTNELEHARRDIAAVPIDDSVTINFYLKEHQDTIVRQAFINSVTPQPAQISLNHSDIIYYELLGGQNEYMSPGLIIRTPSSQDETDTSQTPAISNGHFLTLSEAREIADFDLVCPTWFRPCYRLNQIKKIEDRDALQLLYTDGIDSVSLFEQPLDGQRGLSHNDYREYAVYNNQRKDGGTILAWRDDAISYVLIGNIELSQLMDMAQSISAKK